MSEEDRLASKLKLLDVAPEGLLSSRAAVLFSADYSQKDLEEIQKGFQQIGIDAVLFTESERALAGRDYTNSYRLYFTKRDIKFLIFLRKNKQDYQFDFVRFDPKIYWTDPDQSAWSVHAANLNGLLQIIFRSLISSQKRQNFLVNDFPERSGVIATIAGRRNETWAPNVRFFKIAVPRMGDAASDKELELYLQQSFQAKYEFVEPAEDEIDLRQKGFVYILRFIHARGSFAKDILGYDMSKSETALVTVSYPNGALQLKTIPSETIIYKFYIKNMEDENIYLGPKWDADINWQDALKNHIDGYRAGGKMN